MPDTKTLVITATGVAKASPDEIEILLSTGSMESTYEKSAAAAKKKIDFLRKGIIAHGIDGEKLKTTDYVVNTQYRNESAMISGRSKSVFVGYLCTHKVILKIALDFELLNRILNVIGAMAAMETKNDSSSFNIVFTVKDKDAMKEAVIRDAIKKAKAQAIIIADESEVSLGGIEEINYSFSTVNFNSNTRLRTGRGKKECISDSDGCEISDIAPEDITIRDNITVTWEIL
jgi:hypothetical protein